MRRSHLTNRTAPIVGEPRLLRDESDPVHAFLSSRWARVGAAATGAALLATRLTGAAAAYDDGAASKWMADSAGDGQGAYWWDAQSKDKPQANSPRGDDKKDDKSDKGNTQAENPQQAKPPSQPIAQTIDASKAAEQPKAQSQPSDNKKDDGPRENTQGKSPSNPDGGGADSPFDKRDAPANTQGDEDRDGNNGGGNDDDCSDDNNGNGPKNCDDVEKPQKIATANAGRHADAGRHRDARCHADVDRHRGR
jgi:hypothetical protein